MYLSKKISLIYKSVNYRTIVILVFLRLFTPLVIIKGQTPDSIKGHIKGQTPLTLKNKESSKVDTGKVFTLDRMVVEADAAKDRISEVHLKGEDIRGYFSDISSALEGISGLSVRRTGGSGEYADLSIRGRPSRHTKVYLNGIALNSSAGGAVDINKLPIGSISKISIYKGGSNFKYAGSGTGALISISTFSDGTGINDQAGANIEVGSYGSITTGALFNKSDKGFNHSFTASFEKSDNNYPYDHDNGTIYNKDDDYTAVKDHNSYNNLSAGWSGALETKNGSRISVSGEFSKYRKEYHIKKLSDQRQEVEKSGTNLTGSVMYQGDPGNDNYIEADINGRWRKELFEDPEGQYYIGGEKKQEDSYPFIQARGYTRHSINELLNIESKLDISVEEYKTENLLLDEHEYLPSIIRGSATAGFCTNLFPENRLNFALWYIYTFCYDTSNYTVNHGYSNMDDNSETGSYHNLCLRTQLIPEKKRFRIGLEMNYKSIPVSFRDRYGYGNSWIGNSDLEPEKTFDASLNSSVKFKGARAYTAFFVGKVKDWITLVQQSQYLLMSQNIGDVLNYGVETEAFIPFGDIFSITYNFHYINPLILKGRNPENEGKTIPYFSSFKHNLDTRFNIGFLELGHRINYMSSYKTSFSEHSSPVSFDPQMCAYTSVSVKDIVRLSYRVENYLDESIEQEIFPDYPLPGRRHYFSMGFQF